ncbi:thioredoxin family protein [Deferrisoma palaeochoriense]
MRRIWFVLAGLAVAGVAVWAFPEFAVRQTTGTGLADPADVPEGRLELPAGGKVAFLELGSEGCKPCEAMKPVMQAVRERYGDQVEVVFYDVRKNPAMAREYGVTLIPTQVFLGPDGKEFYRHQGYLPLPMVEAVLHRMGVKAK